MSLVITSAYLRFLHGVLWVALQDRARLIITAPAFEWPVIAAEPEDAPHFFEWYVAPLAAIGPVCSFFRISVFAHHPIFGAITGLLAYVLALVNVVVVSLVAAALSPSSGGKRDRMAALKLVGYSFTPAWIAGVLNLVPFLNVLSLVASLYGLYLIYVGATPVLAIPRSNAIGYTALVVVIAIVLGIAIVEAVGLPIMFGSVLLHGKLR